MHATTLGECWLRTSAAILEHGAEAAYDGLAIRELAHMALSVASPDPEDELIARLGDPAWSQWMHENFFSPENVPELGNARSYAARLFDYEGSGRDQLAWVVERLRADPESRSATITTFEPLLDTTYIPCVSMLDFWAPAGRLELVVYAHSLDFGKKAYGNLVELARLQQLVAGELGLPLGPLDDLRQVGARLRAGVGSDGPARERLAGSGFVNPGREAEASPAAQASAASSVISGTPASAFETGQPTFAPSAAATNASSSIPGTDPRTVSAIFVIPSPGTNVTVAEVSS